MDKIIKHREPGEFKTTIRHTAECAFQRAIILGKKSTVKGETINWIDIELPVDGSNSSRGKCIDLIGKDSHGNYVLCELKFRKKGDNGKPSEAVKQLKEYYQYIKDNAAELSGLRHTNATEAIDWIKIASSTTRLMVVANTFYWETWLIRSRNKEDLKDFDDIEFYEVKIDRREFENQKGNKDQYTPQMPKEGIKWEEKC